MIYGHDRIYDNGRGGHLDHLQGFPLRERGRTHQHGRAAPHAQGQGRDDSGLPRTQRCGTAAEPRSEVDFRERNGVELPQNPDLKLNSIERTLQFMIVATSAAQRLTLYRAFLSALTTGIKACEVKDYRTYNLLYQDMPSDPQWYNGLDGKFAVRFSVKFLEASPTV